MKFREHYAMLTVDTEALPKRAYANHVQKLIWGRHEKGNAGIREMCAIGDDFKVKHTFFVDMCGAYRYPDEMREVVHWLNQEEQDVQLHAHPEVLPYTFWSGNGVEFRPEYLNEYSQDSWAEFIIRHFGGQLSAITGKELRAYRSGSFRWNACTIRALKAANIPLSFNNSMRAYRAGRCVFSEPTSRPYVWSNGVIEVPSTERLVPRPGGKEIWAGLTFPESRYFPFQPRGDGFFSRFFGDRSAFLVFVLHSWSLLYWDENGYAVYVDDQRLEEYRRLLAHLVRNYEVITTGDFLDLLAGGKIVPTHMVDVGKADLTLVV